jgi:hypothetical protein
MAKSTTVLFNTGNTPGMPKHTGQVWVLGGAPNSVEHPQNILDRVLSWAWTSSPMTGSNSIDCDSLWDGQQIHAWVQMPFNLNPSAACVKVKN